MTSEATKKIFDYEDKLFSLITPAFTKPVTGATLDERKHNAFGKVITALEALEFDFSSNTFSSQYKLPKILHVAGTKGKGSTCVFSDALLRSLGLNTGLFTSPHLISVRERIRFNGVPISEEKMQKHVDTVLQRLSSKGALEGLGFFRLMTVLSLFIFSREKDLDFVILEVGLGGLLDATNVVRQKEVSCVTLLDYDHTDFLGDTIEEIAFQKAGIYLKNIPCLTISNQPDGAMKVLKEVAGAERLEIIDPHNMVDAFREVVNKEGFNLTEKFLGNFHEIKFGIEGEHHKYNAALALRMVYHVIKSEPKLLAKLTDDSVLSALQNVSHPGRSQEIDLGNTRFFLDGAHTPKSMDAAMKWFVDRIKGSRRKTILVFNCAHTKNAKSLLESVISSGISFDEIFFSKAISYKPVTQKIPTVSEILGDEGENSAIAISWQQTLEQVYRRLVQCKSVVHSSSNVTETMAVLKGRQMEATDVLITGSLLLVGDALKELDFDYEKRI